MTSYHDQDPHLSDQHDTPPLPPQQEQEPIVPPSVQQRARVRRGSSRLQPIAHLIQNSLSKSVSIWSPLYHNTTIFERVGFLLATLVIICTFFPWVTIKGVSITGWNNFLYPIALPIAIASALCMLHILWAGLGKERPKWFPESHNVYILLGIEILQLGLIAYSLLTLYGAYYSTLSIDDLSISPMIITFCGLGFIGIGLFERMNVKQKKPQTIIHPMQYTEEEDTHDLDRILGQREQEEQHF